MSPPQDGLRKQTTLYDAVAGRVGYEGFLTEQQSSKYRDTTSSTLVPIPPEEALFRRKDAPARYAEDDVYEADRHLQPDQKLPDSDLLKAVHAYVADFYKANPDSPNSLDERSMDETALLAIGILLEEASAMSLGKTGDLALVEAPSELNTNRTYYSGGRLQRKIITSHRTGRSSMPGSATVKKEAIEDD
ncbi:hypothetical protein LTR78_002575 [Recurvomyces mirabilis]|uniref:Uncharacterized protein n=1 Tax=Recurvomyces mirabilis TaxID=574656 RepID=A0AAE0WT98_9PEZI|nr:hypothetical protein LTR78_002575 [Recurvomyces mirabilis]KAK5157504.1 hypothetical protein LTS14_004269 [Recurvomyces mirabilis]